METFWVAIGSLFAGAALVWGIYAWIVDRRDKLNQEERQKFYNDLYDFQDRVEKEFDSLREKNNELQNIVTKLDKTVALQAEKFTNMTDRFVEYSKEVRMHLKKQDIQIQDLGKVIRIKG